MTAPVQLTQDQFDQLLGLLADGGTNGSVSGASKLMKPDRTSIDNDLTENEWGILKTSGPDSNVWRI